VVFVIVVFEGVALHASGPTVERHVRGPAPLAQSSAILRARGDRLISSAPPFGRRIALTFDDGPDPLWTPRIAAVLHRLQVPATFFVIGSQAQRHGDIVRGLERRGFEVGNHTFTHADLSALPAWRARTELALTDATIVALTGHHARFFRPPYSATPDAVSRRQEQSLARAAGDRYLVAISTLDAEDWRRKGVGAIVAHATPAGRKGGIILMHDGGGDRRQTVAALRELIPRLRARGFTFVSLSDIAGLSRSAVYPAASTWQRARADVFVWSARLGFLLVRVISLLVILVGVLLVARVLFVFALTMRHTRRARRTANEDEYLPTVSVLVPAYNEAVGIARSVRSLLDSDYPNLEIVVVDDGSSDETAAIVTAIDAPGLHLVRQDNAGKPDALNTGLAVSTGEIVVMVDGDTLFERDTMRLLVSPLRDPEVGAVSGNTKVGNRRTLLGKWQHIEYVLGFNLDRRVYEVLQCTPTVPGAIGAFRRSTLDAVGGVSGDTLAEDTDLTMAIGRTGQRVVYASQARAWTEAPAGLGSLWRQRYRWTFGTMQAMWKHRAAILTHNPADRNIGRRALPYMLFFQVALPLAAPLIDLYALYGLIFLDPLPVIGYWVAFNALNLTLGAYAFRLDREPLRVLWAMPLQQFVYRQIMYLVVIESAISALRGARARWHHVARTGDVEVAT